MLFPIFTILLAVTVSARPVAQPDSNSVEARELQYAEIEALYAERKNRVEARELQYAEIEDLYVERHRNKPGHHEASHRRPHKDAWVPHGPPPPPPPPHGGERYPHDPHHDGPHNDIVDNIVGFLTHQVRRSLPEASSRVIDGIREFLSHETRDIHEHAHHHRRRPHPGQDIGRNILDFFASVTK